MIEKCNILSIGHHTFLRKIQIYKMSIAELLLWVTKYTVSRRSVPKTARSPLHSLQLRMADYMIKTFTVYESNISKSLQYNSFILLFYFLHLRSLLFNRTSDWEDLYNVFYFYNSEHHVKEKIPAVPQRPNSQSDNNYPLKTQTMFKIYKNLLHICKD